MVSYINKPIRDGNLQTAALLTGINQTDHFKQFDVLSEKISNNCFSLVTILKSRNCPNIKSSIESLVAGIIYNRPETAVNDQENDEEEENFHVKLKKKQLTLSALETFYHEMYRRDSKQPKLVIMLADFEQFNTSVVQDLISIMCSYSSRIPFVLIIGIATALKTIHNVLPFHITNKISVNIFQTESSSSMLNRILDEVILSHQCPFFLSGKSFKVLLDIFLFYDYSLHSFIQGFKMFMLEEYATNAYRTVYCQNGKGYPEKIYQLSHDNCEWIRRNCPSFRRYVESLEDPAKRIELIEKDDALKILLHQKSRRTFRYFFQFFCCLRMLAVLIEDLPRNNLGKQLRELYPICAETEITKCEEFQECFKLLRFSSKDQFLAKLDKVIEIVHKYVNAEEVNELCRKNFKYVYEKLLHHRENIANAGMTPVKSPEKTTTATTAEVNKKGAVGRHEMLQKLKESAMSQPNTKVVYEYERALYNCLDYIHDLFERHLVPFNKGYLFCELFIFSDCQPVRRHIIGASRSSLHNALENPYHYLQCKCCALKECEQILPTMPDISVAYKLHLECNKFINLYDWLQSFAMVVDSKDQDDDEENISQEVQ